MIAVSFVAIVGMAFTGGEDLTGRVKVGSSRVKSKLDRRPMLKKVRKIDVNSKKNKININRDFEIKENKVPMCEKVEADRVLYDFIKDQDEIIQLMMTEVESAMLSTSFWDNIFASQISNPLVSSVQTVAVSFVGGVPNWSLVDNGGINLYATENTLQLNDSFVSLSQLSLVNDNDFNITIDLTLTDGRTFRITGIPVGDFWLLNYFDVNGSFDFKDSNFNGVSTFVGNGTELYGDYFAWPNAAVDGDNNIYNLFGIDDVSAVRIYSNGNEAEITDAIILAIVDSFSNFTFHASLDSVMPSTDYDDFLRDMRDGSGIIHARKILEKVNSYSVKDNLKTIWIEEDAQEDVYAFVCDYGRMIFGLDPRLQKPNGRYVQQGVDHNF